MTDSCVICFDDENISRAFTCNECCKTICINCMTSNLSNKIGMSELKKVFNEKRNGIVCFLNQAKCQGDSFKIHHLIKNLEDDDFNKFYEQWSRCLKMVIENDAIEEQRKIERMRKEEEERKSALDKKVEYIIENVLTLKCPKCANSFDNFTGCFCLKCCYCETNFCAWCINYYSENSDEAHQHLLKCEKRMVNDSYYGNMEQFNKSNVERIKRQINNLRDDELFNDIIERIKPQLDQYKLVYDETTMEIVDEYFIKIRSIRSGISCRLVMLQTQQKDMIWLQKELNKNRIEPRYIELWEGIMDDDEEVRSLTHVNLTNIRTQEEDAILKAKIREEAKLREFIKERDVIIKELYDIKAYLFDTQDVLKPEFQKSDPFFVQKFNYLFSLRYKYHNDSSKLYKLKKIREILNGYDDDEDSKFIKFVNKQFDVEIKALDEKSIARKTMCSNCSHYGNHNRRNCPVIIKEYMFANKLFKKDLHLFLSYT